MPTAQELQTMKELGAMAVKSGFLPASINTPEKAVIIMLKGRELGLAPMHAFSSISVINGKPTMSAELMLGLIYRNVPHAVVDFIETNEKGCTIEAQRPGGQRTRFTFNVDDAKRANLLGKGPWQTYPAAMYRARCISAMARAMFPDALSGTVYTAEELGAEVDEEGLVVESTTPAKAAAEVKEVSPPLPISPEALALKGEIIELVERVPEAAAPALERMREANGNLVTLRAVKARLLELEAERKGDGQVFRPGYPL
jgi:hypothetical protein